MISEPKEIAAAARRAVEAAYSKLIANRWTAPPEAVDRLKDVFRDARERLERITGRLWR
jgi:hypothetical protein